MTVSFVVLEDDPSRPVVAELLKEHLSNMAKHSPPESAHALGVNDLQAKNVTFWSVWSGSELAGCGALKELTPYHGEIKSMHTSSCYLRRGVASEIMRHLMNVASKRGYRRLSLETGSAEAYVPARYLYTRFGFEVCGPFSHYQEDPHSTFMTREL
ncbi:GNAT family N-acetyltransferase [Halomonas elongata]|uniref:GNAT family N-acetyltransferase n=1 Tax=Halomonas elongata TaxID=2746 RepID=UPI00403321AC